MIAFAPGPTPTTLENSAARIVLDLIGYPPEEFGLAGTAPAAAFTDRTRRALEVSRRYPCPYRPDLTGNLAALLAVGEHALAQEKPVTWG